MSQIYVVRHGQASFYGPHYDQLSELGYAQSRRLGEYWANLGMHWDKVFIGPKKRHIQTAESVAEAYKSAGVAFPEWQELPEFDEHQGASVVKKVLTKDLDLESDVDLLPSHMKQDKQMVQQYFTRFQEISLEWVRGELTMPEYESWFNFRARVERGIRHVMSEAGHGTNICVFSSGGPVSVMSGFALGLDDEATMRLSWKVRNGGYSECLFSEDRLSLVSHNATPAFQKKEHLTLI